MRKFEIINPIYTSRILKAIDENYRVRTFELDHQMEKALPGQFIMVWIPGVGERPMSIGNGSPLTISVANVGKVSGEITKLKGGDALSYRGPFGKPFMIPEGARRILCVGGGYGVVPMYFLSKVARESGIEPYAVIGGRSEKDIIWEKPLFAVCREAFITTDDGSRGKKGNVMVEVEQLLAGKKADAAYACGPERMMEAVAKACLEHNVPCQVSVERYMKCGVGVCGSCEINGRFACIDGPVMDAEDALSLPDFGKAHRDASGISRRL